MLIDWFTVIAQIINFLVLLVLLRRFLYLPILNAMQAREQRIAAELESAEQKRREAEAEKKEFEAKNEQLRQDYDKKRAESEQDVAAWHKQALHEARQDVEKTVSTWHKSVEQEKQAFADELRRFSVRQAYAVSRQALQDLADIPLEERMLEKFIAVLESGQIDLAKFKASSSEGLAVRSAFEIPKSGQERVKNILRSQIDPKLVLRFEVDPELLGGIELATPDGYQTAWNLKRYLDALEEELDTHLAQNQAEVQE